MTEKGRASIFGDDAGLDLSGFAPKPKTPPANERAVVRRVSEAARFVSREPQPAPEPPRRRRRRSTRTLQINVKATPETLDTFYRLADAQDWLIAEAFEQAVEALRERLEGEGPP